jgi:hypothetical protein
VEKIRAGAGGRVAAHGGEEVALRARWEELGASSAEGEQSRQRAADGRCEQENGEGDESHARG